MIQAEGSSFRPRPNANRWNGVGSNARSGAAKTGSRIGDATARAAYVAERSKIEATLATLNLDVVVTEETAAVLQGGQRPLSGWRYS